MRLFHHEIFWGDGQYSGLIGREIEKRLLSALSDSSGLQQAGGYPCMPQEDCEKIEAVQLDAVRDIVMAVTNRNVIFSDRQPWGTATKPNMAGWVALIVDHEHKTVERGRRQTIGWPTGRVYYVLLPEELADNQHIHQRLLAPKPKGFNPATHLSNDFRGYTKHLSVCLENSLCIECGIRKDEEHWDHPYCEIHDTSGDYYPQWWNADSKVKPDTVIDGENP